jgi:hypothetical protein
MSKIGVTYANRAAAVAAAARQQAKRERLNYARELAKQERMAPSAALIITVLEGCDEFPFRTKNKTNELVENVFENTLAIPGDTHHQQHGELEQADDDGINQRNKRRRLKLIKTLKIEELVDSFSALVRTFLRKLKKDVHDMLCENNTDNPDSDTIYCGLDSTRDTEEEVEAILRIFPDVVTERERLGNYQYYYPIQFLAFNLKAVSFLPLVARLSIELGLFEEQYRGGLLLSADGNDEWGPLKPLQILMNSEDYIFSNGDNCNQEHYEDQYLQVLIKLRRMDLLKKEDIQNYGLLNNVCRRPYLSKKTLRYLIEWDLNAVLHTDQYDLPLHDAANISPYIQVFQFVFEAGIKYFPKKKGINLLFRKNRANYTPFQYAFHSFGKEQLNKVVDDTLGFYSGDTPINTTEALVMAVIDNNVHLDCVYFLLRREPDILQNLLSSSTAMATVVDKNNNIIGDKNNDNASGNNDNLGQTKTNTNKKRKRILKE